MAMQKVYYFYHFPVSKQIKGDHTGAIIPTIKYVVKDAGSQNLTFTLWSQEKLSFWFIKPSIMNTQAVAT